MTSKQTDRSERFWGIAIVALVYIAVSYFALALRNPEFTQTQVLLGFTDAVLWR